MPRPIRWLQPHTRWFVTTRTLEARLLLVPSPELNERIGFWFGRALKRFPGIEAHALYVASNHLHVVVTDRDGSLSAFFGYFLGFVARDVNALRNRRGPVFHRRFSAEPILDADALAERIAYLVCNPLEDRLVADWREWPGVLMWPQSDQPQRYTFQRLDQTSFARARSRAKRGGTHIDRKSFVAKESVTIFPLPDEGSGIPDANWIRTAVARRAQALRERDSGKRCLGAARIVRQHANALPERSDHSRRPLCHTTRRTLWLEFRALWRTLVSAYREISARFRGGELRARFPAFTFPPWRPLIVPMQH